MDMQKQTGMTGSPIAPASALFWDACWADRMRDLAVRHAACMFRQIKSRMCLDMVFDCLFALHPLQGFPDAEPSVTWLNWQNK